MGLILFITSVVVMTTRTTFKNVLYIIFSIYLAKVGRAQSGDDDQDVVDFMSDEGKTDYEVDRFNEDDKGLEYYSDYDSGEQEYDDMMVDMENADESMDNIDEYGSGGERQVSYRDSIENLLLPDEDEIGETVEYVGKGHLISLLGVEDNEGYPARGKYSEPGPNSLIPTLEFEDSFLRGIRRKKKKQK